MTSLSGIGNGGYNPYAIQQSLFNEIDTSGSGSITESSLEKAVTTAGGTTTAADALYAKLDPNNTGSVTEQQFSQNLPALPFSHQMGAQMIGLQAQGWPGASGTGTDPASKLAQNLFSQIDQNGDGSITKSELEQAVTKAGGTTQAADALYAKLDPNGTGSVSEQQFGQTLSQAKPHHHHHGGHAGASDPDSAQNALASLFGALGDSTSTATSPAQIAQSLFNEVDTTGSGSITQSSLEKAVAAAGGTSAGADALYAKLDPNNTGSVSEQQFAQALAPPSPTGNTAQDAVLALVDAASQSASTGTSIAATSSDGSTSSTSAIGGGTAQDALLALMNYTGTTTGSSSSASTSGNSAQDALLALFNSSIGSGLGAFGDPTQDPLLSLTDSDGTGSTLSASGTSAQDALYALLQSDLGGSPGTATGSSSGTGAASAGGTGTNLAAALALYQGQINQQMLSTMFGSGSTMV
jgi:Ca2+-binding EF-hand superfamily protein